jgi:hypothetical protein
MLNELYHLAKAIERADIVPLDWHKDMKPLPNASDKKPCYRIVINADGIVTGVEPIKNDLAVRLRKWEPSLGNSFPGFNIQPLYRLVDEDEKKRLKKWKERREQVDIELLKKWCANASAKNWDSRFGNKMNKCLGTIPEELRQKCANIHHDFSVIKLLVERIKPMGNGGFDKFFQLLNSYIWDALGENVQNLSLLPVLIHEGSPDQKPENDRGSVSVFLDVPDWKEYPVAHEQTIKAINLQLLASVNVRDSKRQDENDDAFGGNLNGMEEKLPGVKLPVLGSVKLRAMNSESPCQYRYGTIDANSFLIGADSRKRIKGALEWLSEDAREGETWGRTSRRELLFAYPNIIPKSTLKLAACFGARKADDTEARFENYASDVVNCLKGMEPPLKDIELHVFSLRKMDKARTKVVFHRNYSAQKLADAAREWEQGCSNIPIIRMKTWGKEKGKFIFAEPMTPFPLQIADCLNRIWKLDGTSQSEVQSISNTAGIELLLDESRAQGQVPHLLNVAIQNAKGLFISLGNALHSTERDNLLKLDGLNQQKQLMPAILGLLLWKAGIGKEMYMDNPSYLVGRLLKVADELHAVYCKEVRKNSLPPQLLGNALMVAALDSPTQALAQLAMRIAPYVGWAQTNSTESAGLSRYFLKEFSSIERKLRDLVIPDRLDDKAKAQLLLGYISGNSQNET